MPAPVLFLIGHVASLARRACRKMRCPDLPLAALDAGPMRKLARMARWAALALTVALAGGAQAGTVRPSARRNCATWSGGIAARATGCG